jgi:type IV secretory pathway VirB6-like protein
MNKIRQHLQENNMSYFQHFKFAIFHGFVCILAGVCLIAHALIPSVFQTAGSDLVQSLAIVFKKRNRLDDT